MKQDEKKMVSFRIEPELHKKIKMLCLQKSVKMQDFLSKIVEEALKNGKQ